MAVQINNRNVLIVTYYWPPGAGPGVFRWLQLTKYFSLQGVDTHVLTVNPKYASYYQLDHTNVEKVGKGLTVHYAKAIDPINIVQRFKGGEQKRQFNTVSKKGLVSRVINFLRSNLFVPDTRKGWNRFAIAKALEIIDEFQIKNVITTSPPHSSQLVGLAISERRPVKWIADFRDPWVDIFYASEFLYSKRTKNKLLQMELSVLNGADEVITVSNYLADLFEKRRNLKKSRVLVLPNGFDGEVIFSAKKCFVSRDVDQIDGQINIAYIGTITDIYKPDIILRVLKQLRGEKGILLNFIGTVSEKIRNEVVAYGLEEAVNYAGLLDHQSALVEGLRADILLLVIPDTSGDKGILTGKLFEYLALGKPILGIGPKDGDAARIVNETKSGKFFERTDDVELADFLLYNVFEEMEPDRMAIDSYNRQNQAITLVENLLH